MTLVPFINNLHCKYNTSYYDLYFIYNERSIAVENGKINNDKG